MGVCVKVLVTGGAGFIGSHVARELAKTSQVMVLDDLSGGFIENVPDSCRFIQESIENHEAINALFKEQKFDRVYHLAAYAAEGLSHFIKRFNTRNNILGSINLINASVNYGVKHFVFTSSIAVYGENQVPMREDMVPSPEDSYGIAKNAIEQELRCTEKLFGLPYTIFRPHNVYGEHQNIGDRYRNVVGIFMNQCLKGEPLTIYGDGEQQRAFTHIDDVAGIIASAPSVLAAKNQTFNVGADLPFTVNTLASVVSNAMGVPKRVIHLPPRNEVKIAFSDHSKAHETFRQKPSIGLQEGIQRMAEWVRAHGARETPRFSAIEITKNLPFCWQ